MRDSLRDFPRRERLQSSWQTHEFTFKVFISVWTADRRRKTDQRTFGDRPKQQIRLWSFRSDPFDVIVVSSGSGSVNSRLVLQTSTGKSSQANAARDDSCCLPVRVCVLQARVAPSLDSYQYGSSGPGSLNDAATAAEWE